MLPCLLAFLNRQHLRLLRLHQNRLNIIHPSQTLPIFQVFSERYKMKFITIEKEDEIDFSRENSVEN